MTWRVIVGDCVEAMRAEPVDSVDAIVTDPPYGLEFMGKEWDAPHRAYIRQATDRDRERGAEQDGLTARRRNKPEAFVAGPAFQAWSLIWATEALRVLKPGAHLLAFGGTRTYHRLVCALEDAGFEIRDTLAWMYGSGFPKSLDVSKAIDKAAGAEREVTRRHIQSSTNPDVHAGSSAGMYEGSLVNAWDITAPATPAAQQWQGFGTALKPAFEPVVLARKPLSEKTVAANVQRWGTGALNIDGTRIGTEPRTNGAGQLGTNGIYGRMERNDSATEVSGRWPANLILDETAAALLDEQSGELTSGYTDRSRIKADNKIYGKAPINRTGIYEASSGGASRFFYTAKASRRERTGYSGPNDHPTVKPVALMRWLVKLITPPERPCRTCGGKGQRRWTDGSPLETCPACKGSGTVGGVVLDPFMGTGTTGIAAVSEGFGFVGIDQDAGYVALAERRIHNEAGLFSVQDEGGSIDLTKSSE